MALFENLYRQFCDNQFTDLNLISGLTGDVVLAHCLILASAIPPMGKILRDYVKDGQSHEEITIICPEVSLLDLRKVVNEIYCALNSMEVVSAELRSSWAKVFGYDTHIGSQDGTNLEEESVEEEDSPEGGSEDEEFQVEEVFSSSRSSTRRIQKRNFFDDFVTLSDKQKKAKITRKPQTISKPKPRLTLPPSRPCRSEPSNTEKVLEKLSPTKETFEMDFEVRPSNNSRLVGGDNAQHLENPYSIYAPTEVENYFKSLTTMKEFMIDESYKNRELCFMASAEGVYVREGCKPYLPLRQRPRNDHSSDLPVIPDANFAGLFALGVRNDTNVAMPLALVDDKYPQDRICKNLVQVIRHVTGSSLRHVIEFYRLKSFSALIKHEKCLTYKQKFFDMTDDQRQVAFSDSMEYQTTVDLNLEKIKHFPMAKNSSVLAFRMTDGLGLDEITDYALIHGADIDHLKVQTFFEVGKLKLAKVALTAVFFDLMAAFCRLSSPSNIITVPFFRQIFDTHFERSCAKTALGEVMKGTQPPESEARREIECPTCSQKFPLNSALDKEQYREHQLKHTCCDCKIKFASDEEFQNHIKIAHSLRKMYNCTVASCGKGFTKLVALKFHIDRFHRGADSGSAFVCDVCGEAYLNQLFLTRHNYQAHRQAPCPGCEKVIDGGNRGMYQHRAKECPNNTPHLCSHCGQEFKMRVALNNHIRLVHLADKESYPCSLCTKKFACKQRLIVHMDGVHNPVKKYTCRAGANVCDAKFSTTASRKRHEVKKHRLNIQLARGSPKTTVFKIPTTANDE